MKKLNHYNTRTKKIPGVIARKIAEFNEKEYFKSEKGSEKVPDINDFIKE